MLKVLYLIIEMILIKLVLEFLIEVLIYKIKNVNGINNIIVFLYIWIFFRVNSFCYLFKCFYYILWWFGRWIIINSKDIIFFNCSNIFKIFMIFYINSSIVSRFICKYNVRISFNYIFRIWRYLWIFICKDIFCFYNFNYFI